MPFTQADKDAGYLEFIAHELESDRVSYLASEATGRLLREIAERIRNDSAQRAAGSRNTVP